MKKIKIILLLFAVSGVISCEDALVTKPFTIITDDEVVVDAASAEQVLLGAYSILQQYVVNGTTVVAALYGDQTIATPGILSDELVHSGSFPTWRQMDVNNVLPDNVTNQNYWRSYFNGIYITNVLLERVEKIKIDAAQKALIIGQAKFLRALMHFDLVKIYGAIPIATSSELNVLTKLSRKPVADVYNFLISELTEAATLLDNVDYGATGRDEEDRRRAGEWAVKALLARVNLYKGDKAVAASFADDIIKNGGYTLPATYNSVFNGNSTETIFEIFSSTNDQVRIAFQFRTAGRYEYAPSPQIIAAFESGDSRKGMISLTDPSKPEVTKYKDVQTGTDKVIVFRLAEMHLIRAEGNIGSTAADADLNLLRTRAGLPSKTGVSINDILQERFVELCFEGHRWNDLIRTNTVNQVMSVINPTTWKPTSVLLPIPQREILNNTNLTQNEGY